MKLQRDGQSLAEVLIAVAIGAVLITAGVSLIVPALSSNTQAAKVQVASSLGKELVDNIRVWSEGNWNNVLSLATGTANKYYLNTGLSPYTAATGTESITSGPVVSGLVGWWKFDEGTGTVAYDSSGNVLSDNLGSSVSFQPGKIGPYAAYNPGTSAGGTVSYSAGSGLDFTATSTPTITFWVKVTSLSSNVRFFEDSATGGLAVELQTSNGGQVTLGTFSGSPNISWGNTVSADSQWHFFAIVCNGATASLYKDGASISSQAFVPGWASTSPKTFYVGGDVSYPLHGYIDDLRVYNQALSAPQITQIYNATTYIRYFYLSDVQRDSSGNIVTSGGSYDPSTKQATVAYNWLGGTATNTMTIYLARTRNNVVTQNDWSGGSGQAGPVTSTNNQFASSSNIDYSTTTGAIYVSIPGY